MGSGPGHLKLNIEAGCDQVWTWLGHAMHVDGWGHPQGGIQA